jgi:hypothetical protein
MESLLLLRDCELCFSIKLHDTAEEIIYYYYHYYYKCGTGTEFFP